MTDDTDEIEMLTTQLEFIGSRLRALMSQRRCAESLESITQTVPAGHVVRSLKLVTHEVAGLNAKLDEPPGSCA